MSTAENRAAGCLLADSGRFTTPEAPEVQSLLAQMVEAGCCYAILEATSHGLAQHRVDACEFDVCVVTNITHEHLNEHGTYETYRAAKARLFTMLSATRPKELAVLRAGVINRDDSSYPYLCEVTQVPVVTYGLHEDADVRAVDVVHTPSGLEFTALGKNVYLPVKTSLVGEFNIYNILAAVAATVPVLGVDPKAAQAGIVSLKGVPGRMERVDMGQDFTAIVDFAHTPNALRCALETARLIAGEKGRVIAALGSAGLRDREKRRMMPGVAAHLADLILLTAEDPRTESLDAILEEMATGILAQGGVEGKTFWRIRDRGDAFRAAVRMARHGDVVIACGKGHEQSMCFGTTEYAWDDRQALRAALAELSKISGPKMPYLPTQDGKIAS